MAASSVVSSSPFNDLADQFDGEVILPGAPDYDARRAVWNGMIDRRPACIAICKSARDVQRAVKFARANNLTLAVRGGGHNAAGLASVDGGLVIDLRGMRDVVVDPVRRIALAGGGATWGEFDNATAAHGLAATGGAVSTTGIAGLTLGGGLGWLMRSYGLACDNIVGADVVLADGRLVRASERENPELFWALRGGGGNFGVVTTFEFQLHEVSTVLGGMLIYPMARARDVLRLYRDVTRSAPDALTIFAAMMHTPDGVPVVALAICYNGPVKDGEKAIAAIRSFGSPIAGEVGPIPYTALQSMLDAGFPSGLQVHWRSEFAASLPDELIDSLVASFKEVKSPLSALLDRTVRRRGEARPGRRDGVRPARRDLQPRDRVAMDVAERRRAERAVGALDVGRGEAVRHRNRVRELHRRGRERGSRAGVVQPGEVRAARRDQAAVRSDEPLPHESEHPARLGPRECPGGVQRRDGQPHCAYFCKRTVS